MTRVDGPLADSADKTTGRKFERLVDAHCQISASLPAGDEIGFLCSDFVRFSLPHRAIDTNVFERCDGDRLTTFMSPPSIGIPFGKWPRLFMIFLTTAAVRSRERDIDLAGSMSTFMKSLGTPVTGGQTGSIRPFKNQLIRTLSLTSTVTIAKKGEVRLRNSPVADRFEVHWAVVQTDQRTGLPSKVRLGERMFNQMLKSAVPLDMRAVRALQQSPLSLDLYAWTTFRAHALPATHPTRIDWSSLKEQFGAGYKSQSDFAIAVRSAIAQVQMVYPKLLCEATGSHFVIHRSEPSVPRRPARPTPRPPCG